MTGSEDICTTRQAASLLGISLRTAQLWVEEGALKAWKTPGGHRRILRSSVEGMLKERGKARLPMENFNILAVEDDPILLKLYEKRLAAPGSRVVTAADGYTGLVRIGECKPHVLVTDLMMPGVDGFEMLRILERNGTLNGTEVIVVTSLPEEEIEARGGLPGRVVLFQKPLDLPRLVRLVEAHREIFRQHASLDPGAAIAQGDTP